MTPSFPAHGPQRIDQPAQRPTHYTSPWRFYNGPAHKTSPSCFLLNRWEQCYACNLLASKPRPAPCPDIRRATRPDRSPAPGNGERTARPLPSCSSDNRQGQPAHKPPRATLGGLALTTTGREPSTAPPPSFSHCPPQAPTVSPLPLHNQARQDPQGRQHGQS